MHKSSDNVIWVKVTPDEYAFIEAIGVTAKDLGKKCGINYKTIQSAYLRYRRGMTKYPQFLKLDLDGEE